MPVPKTSEAPAKQTDREFITSIKTATFAPTAQVVIAWDGATLRVEAAATNGAVRDKIEDISFSDLPLSIQMALAEHLSRKKAAQQAVAAAARPDPQALREKRIADARANHLREWQEKFDSASWDEQQLMLFRKHQVELKLQAQADARARDIWLGIVADHEDVDLANHVITDPKRRPQRKVVMVTNNGTKVAIPRSTIVGETEAGQKKTSRTKVDISGLPQIEI